MALVEPRTFHFEQILQQVRQGVLRCPRFQRRFVWRRDQILKLFDSIRLRYPVGSLLIWRTAERYESFARVGPIDVPPDQPSPPAEVGYVLDGHQRLSVIFGVFALTNDMAAELSGPDRAFLVYYDLDSEEFIHPRNPKEHHLPVRHLLDADDDLTTWLDKRRDKTRAGSPERSRWDTFRRRATQLQTIFAQYRLPYLEITEATLEEAVNIFWRINKQGTVIRKEEAFSALTWKPGGFDFAGAARELLEQYPRYKNFGTTPVLQAVLAALGEGIYDDDWERVLEDHRARLSDTMKAVEDALGRALEFLDHRLGASSGRVVPYSLHVVFLTEFFRLCPEPAPVVSERLEHWLWATSFASAYTSVSETEVNGTMSQIRSLAAGRAIDLIPEGLRLRPFPRRFHGKAARVRIFHLFLKTREPRDLRTGEVLPDLLTQGMADARTVAPGGDGLAIRLAGRLLVGAGRRSMLADLKSLARQHLTQPLFDDPARVDSAMIFRSHIVPDSAVGALVHDDLEAFIDQREQELIRAEREFARRYVDVDSVDQEVEENAEIDIEEPPESDLT